MARRLTDRVALARADCLQRCLGASADPLSRGSRVRLVLHEDAETNTWEGVFDGRRQVRLVRRSIANIRTSGDWGAIPHACRLTVVEEPGGSETLVGGILPLPPPPPPLPPARNRPQDPPPPPPSGQTNPQGQSSGPSSGNDPGPQVPSHDSSGPNGGVIFAAVAGAVAVTLLVIIIAYLVYRAVQRRRRKNLYSGEGEDREVHAVAKPGMMDGPRMPPPSAPPAPEADEFHDLDEMPV